MLNAVAKRLLGEVSWGLKMRVIMGAGLCMMDMASDAFVIVEYMGKEETRGYGWIFVPDDVDKVKLAEARGGGEEAKRGECVGWTGREIAVSKSRTCQLGS